MPKDSAPEIVRGLVARFDRNRDSYLAGGINEAQLRREFIDPFFSCLGWDIENRQGYAPAYREVIFEDSLRVGAETKAPDYCFRIGGMRKFFVEAKKPAVNIATDVAPAFQLRRYAWSAKLPLSILTDFEEFAVYDCRVRPAKTDKPSLGRIKFLKFKDYPDRWTELYETFSRDAVVKGSFDKFVEENRARKGTTEVDDAFLAEIERWRDLLARNIALRNPRLTTRELNFAVQRAIDRIIFLRICEDRAIETYGQLQALLNGERVYPRLKEVFLRADERYNSGLFHFRPEKNRPEGPDELSLKLLIDDKVLKDIISNLYYPDSPYEFSVLPPEILGQVYEQFLGKVIRLTAGHQAKVEDKPEVRKAGGVYYTPTYIVEYIVKNTVGKLLEGKAPSSAAHTRILDPACGSGSFLLGAYQYLLNWHRDWYVKDGSEKHTKELFPAQGGDWRLTTAKKKEILLNNIYGVDIDQQAVEVTKLSLLLKVLEGENEQTIQSQLKLFQERALPDLGNNIKCGNSLIGPDFYQGEQQSLFDDEELRLKVNAFDWQAEFPDIMKAGGFDAVIGNPPYGASLDDKELGYLKAKYETSVLRGESYLVFTEKAALLLRPGGLLGYIVPDTYLNLGFTKALRDFLLANTRPVEIVVLPTSVFEGATVDTTLLFAERMAKAREYRRDNVAVVVFDKKVTISSVAGSARRFVVSTDTWREHDAFLVQGDQRELEILSRFEKRQPVLSTFADLFSGVKCYEVGKGEPPQTEATRDSKPFTSAKKKGGNWSPLFDGKHIGRYELLWQGNNWVRYGAWLAAPRDPQQFLGPKLLIRKIVGETLISTYFPRDSYCNTLLFILKLKSGAPFDYAYLLGMLNSRAIGWYFRKKFQIADSDTFPQIMIRDIEQFPVVVPNEKQNAKMVSLVERMLKLHKDLPKARTAPDKTAIERQIAATDRQIDLLVYELYGLTEEEIRIVEGENG